MRYTRKHTPKENFDENPPLTDKDFARAKRVEDIPALAKFTTRKPGERGPQKAATKEAVSIRLDKDLVAHYRSLGDGWQGKMNADLRTVAGLHKAVSKGNLYRSASSGEFVAKPHKRSMASRVRTPK